MRNPIIYVVLHLLVLVISLPKSYGEVKGTAAALPDCLGQTKLNALIGELQSQVSAVRENRIRLDAPEFAAIRAKLDRAANQRDAYASGLYWHKDLAEAKVEAARTGRKILSLRLLGNLDEEYSCANSRFFRTLLYPDPAFNDYVRKYYVLHWKSVRPAPLITIDMGDGRRIKRTLTGNSIHYILNAEGRVLDGLPGIYSPAAFLQALRRMETNLGGTQEQQRRWHAREASALCQEWLHAAVYAGLYGPENRARINDKNWQEMLQKLAPEAFPAGTDAGKLAFDFNPSDMSLRFHPESTESTSFPVTPSEATLRSLTSPSATPALYPYPFPDFDPPKGMVERPIIKGALPGQANQAMDPASPEIKGPSLAGRMTSENWATIAAPFFQHSLSLASRRLMAQKQPPDSMTPAEFQSGTPAFRSSFDRMIQRFEIAVAGDQVRNEYYYHTRIHQILETDTEGKLTNDVDALNRKVYDELFLTPDYDAWLGLVPEDTYTALEKDGCACDPGAQPMRQKRQQ